MRRTCSARQTSSVHGSRSRTGRSPHAATRSRAHRCHAAEARARQMAFPAVKFPLIQPEPELGDGWVRFVQTAGGRMGLPAPRRVRGKSFVQLASASAWTTLQLILYANGQAKGSLIGASPFPRHWVYDADGSLVSKSATIDFENWYRESYGEQTPWGAEDTPAFVTAVETELERDLSSAVMTEGGKLARRRSRSARRWSNKARKATSSSCSWTVCSMSRSTVRRSLRWGLGPCSARSPSSREAREPRRCGQSLLVGSWSSTRITSVGTSSSFSRPREGRALRVASSDKALLNTCDTTDPTAPDPATIADRR